MPLIKALTRENAIKKFKREYIGYVIDSVKLHKKTVKSISNIYIIYAHRRVK